MKKFSTQLDQNVQTELDLILLNSKKNIRSSQSPSEAKRINVPQNDYDANLQLQQILEEQERYKQIIIAGRQNPSRGRFRSALRLGANQKSRHQSVSRNMMKSVKSNYNYKASELELNNKSNRSDMPANIELNNNLLTHPEEPKLKTMATKKKII